MAAIVRHAAVFLLLGRLMARVPGAAHTGAYTMTPQPYLEKVGAFFEKNLK